MTVQQLLDIDGADQDKGPDGDRLGPCRNIEARLKPGLTLTYTEDTTMAKKFSLLLAAMAVIAFAVPALANADSVTSSAGVLAKAGPGTTGSTCRIR